MRVRICLIHYLSLKETIEIEVNLIFDKYPDLKIARQELKKII